MKKIFIQKFVFVFVIILVLVLKAFVAKADFTSVNAGLTGVRNAATAWGDYDNDGSLDLLLTGRYIDNDYIYITDLYDGASFSKADFNLLGVAFAGIAWGDYDNDGDLDLLLTGYDSHNDRSSKIYRNDNGSFTDIGAALTAVAESSVAWGDYNLDGYLDILLSGSSSAGYVRKVPPQKPS